MPDEPLVDEKLVPLKESQRTEKASTLKDQEVYIRLRAKGHSDKYIVDHWEELGLSRYRHRTMFTKWKKALREPLRVAIKEEILEIANQFNIGTIHRIIGFAFVMQGCMDELKKRADEGEGNAFKAMSTKELIQEFRTTSMAVGNTLKPYETEVDSAETNNVYMNFFDKVKIQQEDVVDAEWTEATAD